MNIPVTKPYFDKEEEKAVIEALRSGWIVQGPKVEEFENQIAQYLKVKYAVATSSCTTSLHLALLLAGIGPGDEVIVPSLTFIATANSILYTGATPVFADIDPQTFNIDPQDVAKKITKKTKGIIAVHQIGLSADIDGIQNVINESRKWKVESKSTKKRSLLSTLYSPPSDIVLIEDAACALGATYHGKYTGTLGDIATFSFHPRKAMTTGEGGMITTKNKKWADRARVLRAHGMSLTDRQRHEAKTILTEEYHELGYNYRMTDLQAAIGLAQLRKFPTILKTRRRLALRYTKAFHNHPNIIAPHEPEGYIHTYQSYQVRLSNTKVSRETIMQRLLEKGIHTRRGVMAIHETHYYRKRFGSISLPETEKATRETLILPLYPQMTEKEQDYVVDSLLRITF